MSEENEKNVEKSVEKKQTRTIWILTALIIILTILIVGLISKVIVLNGRVNAPKTEQPTQSQVVTQ